MKRFLLDTFLKEQEIPDSADASAKKIYLLDTGEFAKSAEGVPHKKKVLQDMNIVRYCKAELYGSCILGIIDVPFFRADPCASPQKTLTKNLHFGFFMEQDTLYFIGETEKILPVFHRMKENRFSPSLSLPGFFCILFNTLFENDAAYLQNLEERLSELEDSLMDGAQPGFLKRVYPYRKNLMRLDAYYDECAALCSAMRANTNGMLSEEDMLSYGYLCDRVSRLAARVDYLREYVLQLRETYQASLDERQNKNTTLLAVVSAVFLPLSLLAGWYGMNFRNMPELNSEYGYPIVFVLSLIIVIVEIIFFKKHHLL